LTQVHMTWLDKDVSLVSRYDDVRTMLGSEHASVDYRRPDFPSWSPTVNTPPSTIRSPLSRRTLAVLLVRPARATPAGVRIPPVQRRHRAAVWVAERGPLRAGPRTQPLPGRSDRSGHAEAGPPGADVDHRGEAMGGRRSGLAEPRVTPEDLCKQLKNHSASHRRSRRSSNERFGP